PFRGVECNDKEDEETKKESKRESLLHDHRSLFLLDSVEEC
ncbi:hypothetical protein CSUI_009661, partial [Cystoisospora suis]